jgi:hypothetical protein
LSRKKESGAYFFSGGRRRRVAPLFFVLEPFAAPECGTRQAVEGAYTAQCSMNTIGYLIKSVKVYIMFVIRRDLVV